MLVIVVEVGFALLHGAWRYGWPGIWAFLIPGFVISNIMENLSITTGFPFGDYHYTGDGKLFLVPWFIGPAYLATGYLAWVVATVLIGDVRRNSKWLTTVSTPLVAAFVMTAWDLAIDPNAATINEAWIWEDGGGFFGVPLGNFFGWTLTVYLFMQVFALYLRRWGPVSAEVSSASDVQAILPYAATALALVGNYFSGDHKTVADRSGTLWATADIYETQVLLVTYGMGFIALLALLIVAQRPRHPTRSGEATSSSEVDGALALDNGSTTAT
ncbi:carotenoid biosynthesis protein [Nocardioides sp. NPDC127514]|uniref:carotenoid biosynthesis protein n=1 Tax=unclassified Nocardioides TaxID=2615069 RepID=UPI00331BCA81